MQKFFPYHNINKKITKRYSTNWLQLPYGNYLASYFFDEKITNEAELVNFRKQQKIRYSSAFLS